MKLPAKLFEAAWNFHPNFPPKLFEAAWNFHPNFPPKNVSRQRENFPPKTPPKSRQKKLMGARMLAKLFEAPRETFPPKTFGRVRDGGCYGSGRLTCGCVVNTKLFWSTLNFFGQHYTLFGQHYTFLSTLHT